MHTIRATNAPALRVIRQRSDPYIAEKVERLGQKTRQAWVITFQVLDGPRELFAQAQRRLGRLRMRAEHSLKFGVKSLQYCAVLAV
jgi:hypothetical protein